MGIAAEHYLIVLVVAGGLVAALWLRRHLFGGVEAKESAPAAPRGPRSPADDPEELLRFRVELHDVSRDLKGELDSKIAVLSQLIVMAKNESTRLEEVLKQARERESSKSARAA